MKCEPVSTPTGSAVVVGIVWLLGFFRFGCGRRFRKAIAIDGKVRTEHAAHIAARTLLRIYGMRRMVSLGIESGREGQHVRRTKLNAKSASLTPFFMDGNGATRHFVLTDLSP